VRRAGKRACYCHVGRGPAAAQSPLGHPGAPVRSPFLLVQAFGLGGVVSTFGLTLDLIGLLLFLIFVLASSVIGLTRAPVAVPAT
jgi:hypothetical protein